MIYSKKMESPAAIIGLTQFLNKEKIPTLDLDGQRAMETSFINLMSNVKIKVADPTSVLQNVMAEIYNNIKNLPINTANNEKIVDPVSMITDNVPTKTNFAQSTNVPKFESTTNSNFEPSSFSDFSSSNQTLNIPTLSDNSPNFLDANFSEDSGKIDVSKMNIYEDNTKIPVDELLADIDNYIAELDMNGIAHDRIPKPERTSSYNNILTIRNILKSKSERIVAGTIGESLVLGAANVLGSVFDGERKFGPFAPNLVGWDATLATKLHRNRSQIATVTQKGLEQIGLSGSASILVDLFFSAVTYSSRNSKTSAHDRVSQANYNLR
jgi:hypothetical protein